MYYILRRQEPQTCRILVNLLTTKETKPNKERVIPRHEEHHHLQGDPDGCQGSSLATCSLPSTTTKSWTNFCTDWPLPRAWAALLGGHVGVLVKQRKRAPHSFWKLPDINIASFMDYILRRQEPQTCRKQRNRQSLAKGGQRRSQLWLVAVADCVFDWRGSSSWLACFWGSKFCKVLLSKQIMFSPWRPTQLAHFKCSVIECLVAQQDGCLSHTFLWLVAVAGRAALLGRHVFGVQSFKKNQLTPRGVLA